MLKIDPSHWRRPKLTTIHQLVCPWAPWVEGSQFMAEWCEIPLASNPWSPGLLLLLHPCFEALHTTKWATWRGFDVFWCFELEHLQGHYGHYSHFFPKCHIPIQILPGSFWIKKACPVHWTSHLVTWSHDASWAWALPSAVLNSAASIYRCLPFKRVQTECGKACMEMGWYSSCKDLCLSRLNSKKNIYSQGALFTIQTGMGLGRIEIQKNTGLRPRL